MKRRGSEFKIIHYFAIHKAKVSLKNYLITLIRFVFMQALWCEIVGEESYYRSIYIEH